jgi:serine protease Do
MKGMMAARKENKCIHCHDVKVAELRHLQAVGRFTRDLVFTYPAPSSVGMRLDAKLQNQVQAVTGGSPAEKAGLRAGDTVQSADGQRILTLADLTRVLELTPKQARVPLVLRRGSEAVQATLELSGDWRRTRDPSWRESLHVAGPNGGFWGMKLSAEERRKLGLPADQMAVKITFIWGDHTRRAGIKEGDIVVELDGIRRDMTIPQLHAHLILQHAYGDSVPLTVSRNGKEHKLMLELPKERPMGE